MNSDRMDYYIESKAYLNGNVKNSELDVEALKVRYDSYYSLNVNSIEFDDMYESKIILKSKFFSDKNINSINVKIDTSDDEAIFIVLDNYGNYKYDENGAVEYTFQIGRKHEAIIKILHSSNPSKLKITYSKNYKIKKLNDNSKIMDAVLCDNRLLNVKSKIYHVIYSTGVVLAILTILMFKTKAELFHSIWNIMFIAFGVTILVMSIDYGVKWFSKFMNMNKLRKMK